MLCSITKPADAAPARLVLLSSVFHASAGVPDFKPLLNCRPRHASCTDICLDTHQTAFYIPPNRIQTRVSSCLYEVLEHMMLPDDVAQWVRSAFTAHEQHMALELLSAAVDHTGEPVGPRLVRSAAIASRGNMDKLLYYIDLLKLDWRDVIVAGEYDVINGKLVRVRNLSDPISKI
jgi:hypothetical protein